MQMTLLLGNRIVSGVLPVILRLIANGARTLAKRKDWLG
jgi:hypothetical protein